MRVFQITRGKQSISLKKLIRMKTYISKCNSEVQRNRESKLAKTREI